jgi:signal transduction histidine kinase
MAHDLKQVARMAKLATLGEMAVGMAHELSQPLNTIRLAAENTLMAMEQGKSDAEFEMGKLALIASQAESMGDLIKRMCVVGRSEGPQEIIDPREAVRDACSLLAGQFEDEGITVTLNLPERCARVLGRRNELAQVVINLLTNARDAIIETALARSKGRLQPVRGRIDLSVLDPGADSPRDGGGVVIRVKDNGGGIPPDVMERIFDPFFTTKEVTKGTGLGLSISYGIVSAMGGKISVENFGGGALFTIRLPAIEEDRD